MLTRHESRDSDRKGCAMSRTKEHIKGKKREEPAQTAGYTVLARRYRSRDFDEVIGQEPVARTLKNAIDAGRIAHAYLFCGTRGVGKTSMARIFARALNVDDDLEQRDQIADAIFRGDDLDVIEIDGASNRGIQEARDLIAGAGLSPARCRYKIYIIDEVHQITKDAFNALLKTMEEPPAHVKFILCTTEPAKVPATIQSRCQRFDFRAIPTKAIAEHLRTILQQEEIEADETLVVQVARLGNGSMRDALSLLDRLIAAGESKLTMELAEQMLGLPDQALVVNLIDAILAGDPKAGLEAGAELLTRGATVDQAMETISEYLRVLLIVAACGEDCDLIELTSEALSAAAEQASQFDTAALVHMIALCDSVGRSAKFTTTGRALFDAAIVRLCLSERFADITAVLSQDENSPVATVSKSTPRKKKDDGVKHNSPSTKQPLTAQVPEKSHEPMRRTAAVEVKPKAAETSPVGDDRIWPRTLEAASASPKDLAKVRKLESLSFDGRVLRITVASDGAQSARFLTTQTQTIAEMVMRATGRSVVVDIEATAGDDMTLSAQNAPHKHIEEARRIPVVQTAMELFNTEIADVVDLAQQVSPTPPAEGQSDV